MAFFPKILLRSELESYLRNVFTNKELVAAVGGPEAENLFENLLKHLAHPPSFTTVRVNPLSTSIENVKSLLKEEIHKQFPGLNIPILQHPIVPDLLLIPVIGPRGKGIKMTEPVYLSPSFDNVLSGYIFLQNLPSAVVSHVLNPQPGERILDMCAAPGGKTTHIATLMEDQGEVIALDKIASKVEKIKQNASVLKLKCIKAFCFNSTKAVRDQNCPDEQGDGPPFFPESFDRILLDAPCSGMGQRPNMVCPFSLKELTSYQPLQRKLFSAAVELLRPGGTLVYSTCTVTLSENEEQVAWALKTFPCLKLQPQEPHVGGEGMMGAELPPDQLKLLQRFDPSRVEFCSVDTNHCSAQPSDTIPLANKDTIGFFIARFLKAR
ncbi:NOP2/Sun RNA methyltransferase 6 L homeolog isoform X3 [Xenopus laevis]|uniref:NOP2/Sun RNA methyltransferase 6 L homeolog isoform X3 n=1 Tax=Xenopus laevis TaxID=8355 RepID=A0A8J1KZ44_XENLA|nr:NOP2/Sun RNA methyltransferase 6 L homeolog isoform X3 [Xenopus laevis]